MQRCIQNKNLVAKIFMPYFVYSSLYIYLNCHCFYLLCVCRSTISSGLSLPSRCMGRRGTIWWFLSQRPRATSPTMTLSTQGTSKCRNSSFTYSVSHYSPRLHDVDFAACSGVFSLVWFLQFFDTLCTSYSIQPRHGAAGLWSGLWGWCICK